MLDVPSISVHIRVSFLSPYGELIWSVWSTPCTVASTAAQCMDTESLTVQQLLLFWCSYAQSRSIRLLGSRLPCLTMDSVLAEVCSHSEGADLESSSLWWESPSFISILGRLVSTLLPLETIFTLCSPPQNPASSF